MNLEARFWLEATWIFLVAFSVPAGLAYWICRFIIKPRKS
jgi:hypothetical protein